MIKRMIIIATLIVSFPFSIFASGTTGADFLNISVSPYQTSLGGSCSALSCGIASSYYNPAGLSSVNQSGINLMHNIWYQDISYEFAGAAFLLNDRSTIGISTAYLHMGEIDTYNIYDQQTGSISPFSMAGIMSFSRNIRDGLNIGISGKYIIEKLDDVEANGFAFDFGVQYSFGTIMTGLSVNNIGPSIRYESESFSLPSSVSSGIKYSPYFIPISLIAGSKIPFDGKISISTGLEYQMTGFLSFRSGFQGPGSSSTTNGMNFGIGLELFGSNIDYAFQPDKTFGNTHFFSFTVNFGGTREINLSKPEPDNFKGSVNENDSIRKSTADSDERVKNPIYVVKAGLFNNENNARKQVDMLKKFGLDCLAELDNDGRYAVILIKTANQDKAEKLKDEVLSKGFGCFIDFK